MSNRSTNNTRVMATLSNAPSHPFMWIEATLAATPEELDDALRVSSMSHARMRRCRSCSAGSAAEARRLQIESLPRISC